MAISRKAEREMLREKYLTDIINFFSDKNEEVLRVKTNEVALPCVGCEGNEDFIVITVKVPTGANKGLEPYDGYSEAENYTHKCEEKRKKAIKKEEEKKKKIAKDEAIRKKREEISKKGAE